MNYYRKLFFVLAMAILTAPCCHAMENREKKTNGSPRLNRSVFLTRFPVIIQNIVISYKYLGKDDLSKKHKSQKKTINLKNFSYTMYKLIKKYQAAYPTNNIFPEQDCDIALLIKNTIRRTKNNTIPQKHSFRDVRTMLGDTLLYMLFKVNQDFTKEIQLNQRPDHTDIASLSKYPSKEIGATIFQTATVINLSAKLTEKKCDLLNFIENIFNTYGFKNLTFPYLIQEGIFSATSRTPYYYLSGQFITFTLYAHLYRTLFKFLDQKDMISKKNYKILRYILSLKSEKLAKPYKTLTDDDNKTFLKTNKDWLFHYKAKIDRWVKKVETKNE